MSGRFCMILWYMIEWHSKENRFWQGLFQWQISDRDLQGDCD